MNFSSCRFFLVAAVVLALTALVHSLPPMRSVPEEVAPSELALTWVERVCSHAFAVEFSRALSSDAAAIDSEFTSDRLQDKLECGRAMLASCGKFALEEQRPPIIVRIKGSLDQVRDWIVPLSEDPCWTLDISFGLPKMGYTEATLLSDSLHWADHLKISRVHFAANTLTSGGAFALAGAFKKDFSLETLDLTGNAIGPGGTLAFLFALASSTNPLTTLSLAQCDLQDDGAIFVAEFLPRAGMLSQLDLSGNGIGPVGIKSLLSAVQDHPALRHLSLEDNPGGNEDG